MSETIDRPEVADEIVGPKSTSTAVSVLDPLKKIEAGVAALQTEAAALATVEPAGLDRAQRSFRMRCVKVRTDLDAAYETVNRPMLETQRQARALVADIKKAVEALEKPVDEAILAREREKEADRQRKAEVERQRVATIRDRIESMRGVATRAVGKPAAEIESKIQMLVKAFDVEPTALQTLYAELLPDAQQVHSATLTTLRELHAAAAAQEAESARLAAEREALARQQKFGRKLTELRSLSVGMASRSAAAIQEGLAALLAVEIDAAGWGEFADQAVEAKAAVTAELQGMLTAAQDRERVAAEQAAEAQRLAQERATQQRADAEALAARQRADAAAKDARDKADREAATARQADQDRLAAEQKRIDAASAELARREAAAAPVPASVAVDLPLAAAGAVATALPTIKLGDLCKRFGPGFSITAAYVEGLGVRGTKGERGSILLTPRDIEALCVALGKRIGQVKAGAWQA